MERLSSPEGRSPTLLNQLGRAAIGAVKAISRIFTVR